MQSNIVEFFKTRKFWMPIIALLQTVLVWAAPQVLKIEVTPDMQTVMTTVLWGIAALVVHGDIKYDWINAEKPAPAVNVEKAATVTVASDTELAG